MSESIEEKAGKTQRETIITLRVRNAKLECALASKSAQNAIRRIRTELTRRGLTTAQREGILHDNLLMLAECESWAAIQSKCCWAPPTCRPSMRRSTRFVTASRPSVRGCLRRSSS